MNSITSDFKPLAERTRNFQLTVKLLLVKLHTHAGQLLVVFHSEAQSIAVLTFENSCNSFSRVSGLQTINQRLIEGLSHYVADCVVTIHVRPLVDHRELLLACNCIKGYTIESSHFEMFANHFKTREEASEICNLH